MSVIRRSAAVASRALKGATVRPRQVARAPAVAPRLVQARFASSTPERSDKFATLTKEHVEKLRSFLSSPSSLLSTLDGSANGEDLATYNNDWLNKYHGKSQVVVKPRSTEEVSNVMKYCYENDIAIVPQGGNTGLVGAYMTPRRGGVGIGVDVQGVRTRSTMS
jgi:hypothetical protein